MSAAPDNSASGSTVSGSASAASAPAFDLDAYLRRIGFAGAPTPTLDTLRAIHLHHAQSIPFENLSPLLRWPVRLDAASLQRKLVQEGRGGYCFEQNGLLARALTAIGFRVTTLAARVRFNVPDEVVMPRGHMLLRIDLDDVPWIADVGFGGLTLTGPLRLEADVEQETPHEPFRLLVDTGWSAPGAAAGFIMQASIRDQWKTVYTFTLEPQLQADYEVTNWYLSNHPDSHFVRGLMVARPAPEGRYALRNTELAVHDRQGGTERRVLRTAAELREALEGPLGLRLPAARELDAALDRLVASAV